MNGRVTAAFTCGLLLVTGPGEAHGPAPAPLEVLTWQDAASASPIPSLVRTNIGLARLVDGAYRYGCPSMFGDAERARMAADQEGSLLLAIGGGEVFASLDQGCSFAIVDRGATSAYYALDTASDGSGAWALSGNVGDGEGAVARYSASGVQEVYKLFAGSEGWIPDSLALWSQGERSGVLLAGAAPNPRFWRGERHESDGVSYWTWSSWPLNGLAEDTAHLRVTDVDDDGGFWLIVTDGSGRTLWRADFHPDAPPGLTLAHAPVTNIFGPVETSSGALAVFDGELQRESASPETLAWSPLGPVDWTCLHGLEGILVACKLTGLMRLDDTSEDAPPSTETLFHLDSLEAPLTTCLSESESEQCESDWVHFGAEAGLYTPPATEQADPGDSESGCSAGAGAPWGALWITLLALAPWCRRRGAC